MIEQAKNMVGSVAGEIRTRPFRSLAKAAAGLGLVMMAHGTFEAVDSRLDIAESGDEIAEADERVLVGALVMSGAVFGHMWADERDYRRGVRTPPE